ncbi:MAG: hypothetical protein Kow0029_16480 [Candidatus Rifleibacteriota bacterium]
MSLTSEVIERHVFISSRKEKEVFQAVFEKIFAFPVNNISVEYLNQPDETYASINDRTKKILLNIPKPENISCISGYFDDGGSFRLQNGNLHILVREDEYNYELLDSLKNFLGHIFPLWIFKNPYIWGVTLYEQYERQHFFETRNYSARSRLLEEPEVDIYRRDDGIIHKFRFFTREDLDQEEGMKYLQNYFESMLDGLKKRNYEGLEVLHLYCTDKAAFRKFEPRTKLGKDIKSLLHLEK